jgi:ATP-dependent Clp protease ATP-binding subunit ClpC
MSGKLDRFTPQARRVLSLAQDAAVRLHHNEIDAEHLLFGLASEEQGTAAQVLRALGVEPGQIARISRRAIGQQRTVVVEKRALTPRAKQVLERAVDEAPDGASCRRHRASVVGADA